MAKITYVIKQEDLDDNPELVEEGVEVGDEFEFETTAVNQVNRTGPRPGDKNNP